MSLECKNITKSYGSVRALVNANLSVKTGEIRALLGGNGSGKSTLAKILGGAVSPNSAEIVLDKRLYSVNSPKEAKKKGVVITSQELSLFRGLSVYENLMLCDIPARSVTKIVDNKEMKLKADEVLNKLDLMNLKERKIEDLAANELYLVEFVKALLQRPKLLVIDEITSALYRKDVEIVKSVLHELKNDGVSVIFISHRMPEIFSICDSVTVMRNGETIDTFRIQETCKNDLLSLMTGLNVKDQHAEMSDRDFGDHPIGLSINNLRLERFNTRIDLEVRENEIVCIAGLEGQGQSDLIKNLFAINNPLECVFQNNEITLNKPKDAVNIGFAYVSGNRETEGTFQQRSISENLRAVSDLVLKNPIDDENTYLKKYGVVFGKSQDLITSLSGGNQQKVVIGRWMATTPKIFIAEDPTKGIDVQARRDVHKMLYSLAKGGSMVVMSSSDDEEIVELTTHAELARVLVMYEGKVVAQLEGQDITLEKIAANSLGKKDE